MNEEAIFKLNQIFYSLISELRYQNKEAHIKFTLENNNDSAVSILNGSVEFELKEKHLSRLQEEFEEVKKSLK